ncbi:MAG: hypothetical protein H7Y32_00015 [Chloroflexales bacterium]|nr:hypothetical protein [Chloroflexales bacterium]
MPTSHPIRLRPIWQICLLLGLLLTANGLAAQPRADLPNRVFVPLVTKAEPTIALGVDFGLALGDADLLAQDLPVAQTMGARWSRVWISWASVEPATGVFRWDAYDAIFKRHAEMNIKLLPVLYEPPSWAAPQGCGPISDTVALEGFVAAAIERYGSAVDAWEFVNEPDGKAPLPAYGPAVGCWGGQPAQYARQLGLFAKVIRARDPGALVLFGGLAYDSWAIFERSFLDRALKAGAGASFDGVSLHYYPINPAEFPTPAHKVREIRAIMEENGVFGKRIWITETGMWSNGPGGIEAQRNFIAQDLSRALCAGVDTILWFAVRQDEGANPPLWRWLIDTEHRPAQAYATYQYMARTLEGARCVGAVAGLPPDVEAYRFSAPGRTAFVLWANRPTNVTLAADAATLTTRDGTAPRTVAGRNGAVTFSVSRTPIWAEVAE